MPLHLSSRTRRAVKELSEEIAANLSLKSPVIEPLTKDFTALGRT
jgi:hypothetical protein